MARIGKLLIDGGVYAPRGLVPVTGNKTLGLSDRNTRQVYSSSSAGTITIPADATVAYPSPTEIEFTQEGTGALTIVPASGVNIRRNGNILVSSVTIAEQYGYLTLIKVAANEWRLVGLSSGVAWADVTGKPSFLANRFDQITPPASPVIGWLWTERAANGSIIANWEWDGTDWLGAQIIVDAAGEGNITAPMTAYMKATNPGYGTGVKLQRFLLNLNNAGTHSSTSYFSFQLSWANTNGIMTNLGSALRTDQVTGAQTIAATGYFTYAQLAYFALTVTRPAGTPSMGFNGSVVARYYR